MKKPKMTLGRREKVDFPALDLYGIDAKIDTGAYTSSIHCSHVEAIEKNGAMYVMFNMKGHRHEAFNKKKIIWPLYKQKQIKNSFGQTEERFVIKTKIILFDMILPIELTLADRSQMDYPVLLGRKILKKGFVVDVTKVYCAKKKKNTTAEK